MAFVEPVFDRQGNIVDDSVTTTFQRPTSTSPAQLQPLSISADNLGALYFPVVGADIRDIQSTLGAPRDDGARLHKGVDIFADAGTAVIAAVSGTVITGSGGLGGNWVKILDEDGNVHYYAHLQTVGNFTQGTYVQAGTQIGTVGSTGNAEGGAAHLHYSINEATYNGTRGPLVDAYAFLAKQSIQLVDESMFQPTLHEQESLDADFGEVGVSGEFVPRPTVTEEEALQIARERWPLFLGLLSIDELRSVFVKVIREGISDPDEINALIDETEWAKSRTSNQESLEIARNSDPVEYRRMVWEKARELRAIYVSLGLAAPEGDITNFETLGENTALFYLSAQALYMGLSGDDIRRAVVLEMELNPAAPKPPGSFGTQMDNIAAQAANYFVTFTDQELFQLAQQLLAGDITEQGVTQLLQEQAMSQFADYPDTFVRRLQQGFTPEMLFSQHRQVAAQALEIDPDQVDFNDPFYAAIFDMRDENGNRRPMSTTEMRRYIRSTPRGKATQQYMADEAGMALNLLKVFGARK